MARRVQPAVTFEIIDGKPQGKQLEAPRHPLRTRRQLELLVKGSLDFADIRVIETGVAHPCRLPSEKSEHLIVSDQLLIALFSWVISISSYEMPHDLPEVKYLQPDQFVEVVCGGTALCTALGMYRDGTATVYLHESLRGQDNLGARSVVVHELVHYAQDVSARWREVSCEAWLAREKEAYRVQAAYVRSYGSGATLPQPLLTKARCGKNPTRPPESRS